MVRVDKQLTNRDEVASGAKLAGNQDEKKLSANRD